jgi:hypothetical protein
MSDDDELIERAVWMLQQNQQLRLMAEYVREAGPAAGADLIGKQLALAGELIDVNRHLADGPRVSEEKRRRFRRIADEMNDAYAELNKMYQELRAREEPEGDEGD